MTERAWQDEDDEHVELKPFQRSDIVPSWAATPADKMGCRKRQREGGSEGPEEIVDGLLASTAPILTSKHHRKRRVAPRPLSTVFLERDTPHSIAWHPSGDVVVAACDRTLQMHHCSGRFVDKLSIVSLHAFKRRVTQSTLLPGGNEAIVLLEKTYWPLIVHLGTSKVTELNFLSTRTGTAYKNGKDGHSIDETPSRIACETTTTSAEKRVLVACGSTLVIGSVAHGTVSHKIIVPDDITDCCFAGSNEILCTSRNRMYVYDVRKTAKCVRVLTDHGSLLTTCVAQQGSTLCLGSSSGVVNLYSRGACDAGGDSQPLKSLMNLTTSVSCLEMSRWESDQLAPMLAMSSNSQAGGLRLVSLPGGTVAPGFPEVGMKHGFVQCLAFHPTTPILSVGEQGRIVNYALLR